MTHKRKEAMGTSDMAGQPCICRVCDEEFTCQKVLTKHMQTHKSDRPYLCSDCGQSFKRSKHLSEHVKIHTGEKPYTCTVCSKSFRILSGLNSHMRTHTGEKPFSCTVCSKSFSVQASLIQHMRTHTGEKPYKCSVCTKSFSRATILKKHMRTHTGEKPFMCSICNQTFGHADYLTSHLRTHTVEKSFTCSLCDRSYSEPGLLGRHEKYCAKKQRKFPCSHCGLKFLRRDTLTNHMRRHTGEKPHVCTICGKTFTLLETLTVHVITHTAGRPLTCPVCGKSFRQKRGLNAHMIRHNENKLFACSVCGESFGQSTGLTAHISTHGKQQASCYYMHNGSSESSALHGELAIEPQLTHNYDDSENVCNGDGFPEMESDCRETFNMGEESSVMEQNSQNDVQGITTVGHLGDHTYVRPHSPHSYIATPDYSVEVVVSSLSADENDLDIIDTEHADHIMLVDSAQNMSFSNKTVVETAPLPEMREFRVLAASSTTPVVEDAAKMRNSHISALLQNSPDNSGNLAIDSVPGTTHDLPVNVDIADDFSVKLRNNNWSSPSIYSSEITLVPTQTRDRNELRQLLESSMVCSSKKQSFLITPDGSIVNLHRTVVDPHCHQSDAFSTVTTAETSSMTEAEIGEFRVLATSSTTEVVAAVADIHDLPMAAEVSEQLDELQKQRQIESTEGITEIQSSSLDPVNSSKGSDQETTNDSAEKFASENGCTFHTDHQLAIPILVRLTEATAAPKQEMKYNEWREPTNTGETTEESCVCKKCDKEFTCPKALSRHMWTHKTDRQYLCSDCGQSFRLSKYLSEHRKIHTGEKPFTCTICSKSFRLSSGLTVHKRSHNGDKPHPCTVCGKSFSVKTSLVQHMRTHTGDKPYTCTVCNKMFSRATVLKKHMRTHTGEKPFMCSVCNQTFSHADYLTSHLRTHTVEKSFTCPLCNRSYSEPEQLSRHEKYCAKKERKFPCSHCGLKFLRRDTLTNHMRRHTGEKPHVCTVCGKTFTLLETLTVHMITHTAGQPLTCPVCGKSFRQKRGLSAHMIKHNEEKLFACSVCGESFSQLAGLTTHISTHG